MEAAVARIEALYSKVSVHFVSQDLVIIKATLRSDGDERGLPASRSKDMAATFNNLADQFIAMAAREQLMQRLSYWLDKVNIDQTCAEHTGTFTIRGISRRTGGLQQAARSFRIADIDQAVEELIAEFKN